MPVRIRLDRALPVLGAVAALGAAAPAAAQPSNGFLLGAPSASLTVRGGYSNATASGQPFTLVTQQLTLGRGDFASPALGADLGIRVASRLDVLVSVSFMQSSAGSEFREFLRSNDAPITQTTRFQRVPLQLGVRGYLLPAGESVGTLAWIPRRLAPWVAVTGGLTHYRFEQNGDFVDSRTLNIFPETFKSSGWAPSAQAVAGLDVSLTPRFAVTVDGRYLYAQGSLGQDFRNFPSNDINLSGLTGNVGLTVRF